ncbi:MAG: alpha/beta hydrolase [Christensenellales bacterium]
MSFAKTVFVAIDYLFDGSQNRTKIMRNTRHVKCEYDIPYADEPECKLNTYVVEKNDGNKYPVIFEIHGGGFVAGDKKYRRALCRWYAAETGAFVVNVNYGLGNKVLFPKPVMQLVQAVNWVVDNAEKYNLDLSRFIVTGDSAGGYYSAMLAVIQDNEKLQNFFGKMKAKFTATVLDCGIYDLQTALNQKIVFGLTGKIYKDFIGGDIKDIDKYEYLEYISPADYITEKFPKAFLTVAGKDFFCKGQGEKLAETLNKYGVYNEIYSSTKFMDNHTFPLTWTSKAAKENNEKALSFINRFFAGEI